MENEVSIVIHGHDHFFAEQELDGIVYQLVPQPGHPGGREPRSAAEYGYEQGVFRASPGHLRVTVAPDQATFQYIRSSAEADGQRGGNNREVAHSYTIGGC